MGAKACKYRQEPATSATKDVGSVINTAFGVKNCGDVRGNFYSVLKVDGIAKASRYNEWIDVGELSMPLLYSFYMPDRTAKVDFYGGHAEAGAWIEDYHSTITLTPKEVGKPKACKVSSEPSSSKTIAVGANVPVELVIRNCGDAAAPMGSSIEKDGVEIAGVYKDMVNPGETFKIQTSFAMPNSVTKLKYEGYSWQVDHWSLDVDFTITLTPKEAPPEEGKFKRGVKVFATSGVIEGANVCLNEDSKSLGCKNTNIDGITDWFYAKFGSRITGKVTASGYNDVPIDFTFFRDQDGETITSYMTGIEEKGDIIITVTDQMGIPIKYANVYRDVEKVWEDKRVTNEKGEATYKDLPYAVGYGFKAQHPDYGDSIKSIPHFDPVTRTTIELGSEDSSVKFFVVHPTGGALLKQKTPLEGVSVHMWSDELGYDETKLTDAAGYADFGVITPGTYSYHVEHTPEWQPFDATHVFTKGHSYTIEVQLFTKEEAVPGWVRVFADFLGIPYEQAKYLIIAGMALFVILIVVSLLRK